MFDRKTLEGTASDHETNYIKEFDLETILKFIDENEVIAYDTETTGLNVRKDVVIGFGISSVNRGFYIPVYRWDTESASLLPTGLPHQKILAALKTKKLLTWNASFDMRITKNNLGVDLLDNLHADVLLLKHTCDEEFPFGLKEVGAKIFGSDVTKEKEEMLESIKKNGGSAKQYFKADTEILGKYCIQDCVLTFRLFEHYSNSLHAQGLTDFYYHSEVVPLYKQVTIPMENAGVDLDVELLERSLKEINEDLYSIEYTIQKAIEPHLGLFTAWFLNKDYPTKTRTGKAPAWTKRHASQYDAWRADNTGYMFNLQSKYHLKKLFFDTLGEEPLSKTPTGMPQVDEDFLLHISSKYDWVKSLIEFNKLTKIKGTYIERFLEENEDGRFYPSFMQHRTVSGRYGSDLQQLPRLVSGDSVVTKHNNRVREFIKAPTGHKLISADYAQLEPRCFAHTSGDSALQHIFREGTDFYTTIAKKTEGLEDVSKDARQKAKAYALGIAYGMTGYKLKFEIDCDQDTADGLVSDYLRAFPELAHWMEESKHAAYMEGFVQSQAGRIRHLGKAKQIYERYGTTILDDLRLWQQFNKNPTAYEKAKTDRREFKNLCNNAINFQVQSLAASIVNRAAISINKRFKAEGMRSVIVAQIHDELVVRAPDNEVHVACIIMKTCMENVTKLDVPLIAEPKVGDNFAQVK